MEISETLELHSEDSNWQENDKENDIRRYSATQLSYNEFYWKYMKANWPVLLTDISNNWECRVNWTRPSIQTENPNHKTCEHSTTNFEYLKEKLGNRQVPVADCSKDYYNSHAKITMQFYDFLNYWKSKINTNSDISNCNTNYNDTTTDNLYLKDWHLQADMPDYNFYVVPKHFASDWLNEKLVASKEDDYKFVYMGPKDSWTPFHADVFGSYSWSTNICGRKKWILLPLGEELKLSDHLGNLPFRINELQLKEKNIRHFVIIQDENEALFVPTGWYHQVLNLADTISINHNWFNACSIQRIWENLSLNLRKVINEIDDCRQMDNFEQHCQIMLRASFGINFLDFLDLLEFITKRRIAFLRNDNSSQQVVNNLSSKTPFLLNRFHIQYDLNCIQELINNMLQDDVVSNSRLILYRRCINLLELTKVV